MSEITVSNKLGYIQSKLDGTEYKTNWGNFEIPEAFSYRNILSPVKDQGETSMCVAYSCCYVLNTLVNMKNGVAGVDNGFSPEPIYNARTDKFLDGMMPKDALRFLRHTGENNYKITNYAMISNPEQAKRTLLMSAPFILGMMTYNNGTDFFWRKGGQCMGGHCVTCVGYDETGFEILNSWGEKYADHGIVKLPYNEWFNVMEAWCITL